MSLLKVVTVNVNEHVQWRNIVLLTEIVNESLTVGRTKRMCIVPLVFLQTTVTTEDTMLLGISR